MRALLLFAATAAAAVGCGKAKEGDGGDNPPATPRVVPPTTVTRNWKDFSSGRHEFKVSFPWGDPTERPGTLERLKAFVGDSTAYCAENWQQDPQTKQSKVADEFCIVAGKFGKSATKAARDDAVQYLLRSVATPKGGAKSEPKAITWAERPATETVYAGEEKDGKKPRVIVRQLLTDAVVYLGVVRDAGGLTDAEVARFFNSFEVTPAGKPK